MTAAAVIFALSACGGGSSPGEVAGNNNRAPVAVADVAVQAGGGQAIAVLANDREPDGDALSITSMTTPAHGVVSLNDNGTPASGDDYLDYTPNAGYGGVDSFSYTISDPQGLTASATVTVQASGSAPVANSDDASTPADTPVSILVLANDSDPNGLTLNLVSVTLPGNGVASINNNGTPSDASDDYVDYGPNSGFSGSDSFSYMVSNGVETASAAVNVIVGGTGSEGVSGDVTKGPISGATIRLYRIDGQGMPVGSPVAQTTTNAQGRWTVAVPLPREPLLVVSEGGRYTDETDSNPDPSLRRVIQLQAGEALQAVMPAADDYLSLNLYTNAMLEKSRAETLGNEFEQVYAANRSLLSQAIGFDPVSTAPTDPGNPNPAASEAARQYALLLGGASNVLNAVAQRSGQNAVAFNVLDAFVRDFSDCGLDGNRQGVPVQFLFLGAQRNMPTDLDLNLEITRFRNNNFDRYAGISASIDEQSCAQSGAVPDTTAPVITLAGANPLTLEGGGVYSDAGFTASDDRDGDVTASVTVSGSIDTTSVGPQTLTFSAADAAGNVGTATRTVNVVDTTPPVLTLNGTTPVTVLVGTSYVDSLGASASDAVDGDLSAAIVAVNPVDINTPGSYTLTYDVSDSSGNAATRITRIVNVVDTMDPVITLNGNSPQAHEAGTPYVDAGASAFDLVDGDLTASIITVNNVNSSVVGSYTVTYDVSDSGGNAAATVTRIVNVTDSTQPVITLTGANPQTIEAPDAYSELGATASDSFEGDISAAIVIDASAVDTSTPGTYLVTYDVADGAGNAAITMTRTVSVVDTTAPVITLTGANPQTVEAGAAYAELGATASDTLDGDLTASLVIDTTGVDPSMPGTYIVTYDVTDAAGNAAITVTRTVNVADTTPPVITLTGANPQAVEANTAYTELGATASDTLDGDVSASIVIDASAVNTSVPGGYVVTYNVMDAAGNAAVQVTRTVNVTDTTSPVITLIGADPITHEAATPFTDPGASASDTLDGDLTASVVTGGSVDVNVPGSYVLTYDVSDGAGNAAAQVTRTVNVVDTTPPVLTLIGANPVTHEAATPFTDPGASASDTVDGDLTASVVTGGSVDVNVPGSYVLTYDVSDAAGNAAAQVTRTVNVTDTTPPVITLIGVDPQVIEAPNAYAELSATASDTLDGDVSASIVIDASAVNTSVPGTYIVTYDVTDAAGNAATQVTRTVNVADTTPPVITLTGANPQVIEAPNAYTELGATASDTLDGDISAAIAIDASAVNTSAPGSHVVTYDVMDAAGNAATQVTRTVSVVDTTPPVITLIGANPVTHEAATPFTDPGASAIDTVDGDITASIVTGGSVDVNVPGSYVLTYDVNDAAGNAAVQVTRTVNVTDTTPPVITLTGANPQVIEAPNAYPELGATASDTLDGDISAAIAIDASAVNTSVPGTYIVTYDVTDAAGNAAVQVTRTVNVTDTTPPVITLTGANPQTIALGSPYSELGATASDTLDGDLSASLVIDASAVDTSTIGTYVVTYDVTDGAGNAAAQLTRTVIVGDTTPPVITLVGADPLPHEAGTPFTDPGATASDNVDGDITGSILVGGTVDQNVIGDYVLTYDVSDASANAATQVTRTVQVRDTIAPVIALVGADPLVHEAGTAFVDPGATASDSFAGDVSASIVTGGSVDSNVIGDYVLTYDVSDSSGNAATQVTRAVQVRDTTAPTLTLTGADPLAHEAGIPFTDPGATASDSFEGDLTASIVPGGTVDENVIGDYVLTYDVSDSAGNAAVQLTRTVQVRDTVAPIITIVGANPDTVAQGSGPYADPGATASDSFEGDLTPSILVTGVVDTTTVGTYVLSYDVDDSSANSATTVSRTVDVVAPAETVDADGDGLSDAIEQAITGDPNAVQLNTFFVDPDPSITVRDGTSWATAYAGVEDIVAANGGFIPQGLSAAQPTYIVLTDTSADPATLANPDKYQLTVANGTCSHIAIVGSMGPGTIHPGTGLTEPSTKLNAPNARILNANNCQNLQFYQLQFVNSGGTAVANGGAINISNIDATFDSVIFEGNQATISGGALEIGNSAAPTVVRNSVFRNNNVEDGAGIGGGAIRLANNGWMDISDTLFLDNSAQPGSGGAIYAVQNADLDITRSAFSGNDATLDGGAIFIERNNVSAANEISHSLFSGNEADREGGAVYEFCNLFVPPLRMFNNLITGNAALRGGGVAIDDCDATQHDNNTFVFNEATATGGGGAVHIDTVSLDAPNFRPMPEFFDNVMYGNIDGSGVSAYSINNLPSWGQQQSYDNLLDDSVSATFKDLLIGDPALEFDIAWYLNQGTSQGIDLSSVNANNASKFQATPERTTDRNGSVDAGKTDTGFHYPVAYPGDAISVTAETALKGNDGPRGQDLLVTLRDGVGDPLASGYRVAMEIVAGSAPVNLKIVSFAPDPLAPVGAYVATDVSGGQYKIVVDTNGVPGPDSVTVDVYADGVLIGQVIFPVNP